MDVIKSKESHGLSMFISNQDYLHSERQPYESYQTKNTSSQRGSQTQTEGQSTQSASKPKRKTWTGSNVASDHQQPQLDSNQQNDKY